MSSTELPKRDLKEIVVCSLELWDEVWRRNQFFAHHLLVRNPELRILFVEPPADPIHDVANRRRPAAPSARPIGYDSRLIGFRPLKAFPRRLGPLSDALLRLQVRSAARAFGLRRPLLWLNDVTYAPLISTTGWPTVYDVTDDWLLAPFPKRELERLTALDALAMRRSVEVAVCSPSLERHRGRHRPVTLVSNGVDADHFRTPQAHPADLPGPPTAVYVGTLHESRLDVALLVRLGVQRPELNVVLVGPVALGPESLSALARVPNITLLGMRPYDRVPGYMQHADVLIVPHVVTPFTDSLDPIKAYEYMVAGKPVVATPVAGFREQSNRFAIAAGEAFVDAVAKAVGSVGKAGTVPSWEERAGAFESVLRQALRGASGPAH